MIIKKIIEIEYEVDAKNENFLNEAIKFLEKEKRNVIGHSCGDWKYKKVGEISHLLNNVDLANVSNQRLLEDFCNKMLVYNGVRILDNEKETITNYLSSNSC